MARTRTQTPEVHLEDLARRIRAEFIHMPGMRLTFGQARRLWHLSNDDCEMVLEYLTGAGLLTQDEDDRFCRPES